jgi:hypothetical protein
MHLTTHACTHVVRLAGIWVTLVTLGVVHRACKHRVHQHWTTPRNIHADGVYRSHVHYCACRGWPKWRAGSNHQPRSPHVSSNIGPGAAGVDPRPWKERGTRAMRTKGPWGLALRGSDICGYPFVIRGFEDLPEMCDLCKTQEGNLGQYHFH